ncbi:hypothetical protein L1887_52917 [Cichorium endivia]|nr:hypothetical protein L1887_52917 [Cichorium endivia]
MSEWHHQRPSISERSGKRGAREGGRMEKRGLGALRGCTVTRAAAREATARRLWKERCNMPQEFRRIENRPVSTAILEPRLRKGSVGRVEVVSPAQMQPLVAVDSHRLLVLHRNRLRRGNAVHDHSCNHACQVDSHRIDPADYSATLKGCACTVAAAHHAVSQLSGVVAAPARRDDARQAARAQEPRGKRLRKVAAHLAARHLDAGRHLCHHLLVFPHLEAAQELSQADTAALRGTAAAHGAHLLDRLGHIALLARARRHHRPFSRSPHRPPPWQTPTAASLPCQSLSARHGRFGSVHFPCAQARCAAVRAGQARTGRSDAAAQGGGQVRGGQDLATSSRSA